MKYDVIIIGAGVVGCAVARELSRYPLKIGVLEKEEDVCCGTSKANSGIVHAGFDAESGTLKAKLNVEGNRMMEELSKELDFPFYRNGSLVLCFHKEDEPKLKKLLQRGQANGVEGLELLGKEELQKHEPMVSDEAVAALYAPTGGIVCPFGMTIALAENAYQNGVEFFFDQTVTKIEKTGQNDGMGRYRITAGGESFAADYVINAAGVYADVFHNMVSEEKIHITPRRGAYCLLDKSRPGLVGHTVFQLPGAYGKGVLVTPTVHGNLMVGPTALDVEDKEGNNTTGAELKELIQKAKRSVPGLPMNQVITSFAGLRAHEDGGEFIIGEVSDAKGFLDCAGIESPGLTSAPAIGKMVAGLVADQLQLVEREDFVPERKGILNPAGMEEQDRIRLIQEQPAYGTIVCRCEMITEGEIIDAINRPLGAKSLDGVKRRTRAGMGRCQSGFCSPRVMEILSRERKIPMEDVTKSGGTSRIIQGRNKDRL
ncbi:MAG: NAD(P)/FAD-dependent oxidoreductase [Lachnospiraceae bacterium]|jgi:glycerol-3-phosphate dehydrogenase|nr:NAD(P)/FAD-dependent oxidoreductase [Lachnospiraceae bacterium]